MTEFLSNYFKQLSELQQLADSGEEYRGLYRDTVRADPRIELELERAERVSVQLV